MHILQRFTVADGNDTQVWGLRWNCDFDFRQTVFW